MSEMLECKREGFLGLAREAILGLPISMSAVIRRVALEQLGDWLKSVGFDDEDLEPVREEARRHFGNPGQGARGR